MEEILKSASSAWGRLGAYRTERARCKRYVYGDQWDDPVCVMGKWQTEAEFIQSQGQVPLKNNILRRILRNVVGLYRSQYKVPLLSSRESGLKGPDLKEANRRRREWFRRNSMEQLAPRLFEEFLISGMVAVKVEEGRILPVTPDNFFFRSDGYDPRCVDVDLIGEIHHVGYGTLVSRFCRSADDYRRIAAIYGPAARRSGACRVTEVWRRVSRVFALVHDEASATLRVVPVEPTESGLAAPLADAPVVAHTAWRRLWFADDGSLLRDAGVAPAHPYVFKAYPFIDGEVHSYISDLIDQQRYVNRLITLYDFIMKSSAKGVLLFPDECIPAGMDLADVAEEWGRFNGVIPYRARPGVPMPAQVSANSTNIGITELLKVEMQMLEDISGVSPTLQGKLVANSTSGTLFAQQNEAAQTSLLDILRSFTDFLADLAGFTPKG